MKNVPTLIGLTNTENEIKDLITKSYINDFKINRVIAKTNRFANGEISVDIISSVRNQSVIFYSKPRNYTDIFELFCAIDAAKRASASEVIAIIPCLPHSRQERRPNNTRTSITARLYADLLQEAGLDRLITVDVHAASIEGFYKIPVDTLTAKLPIRDFIISSAKKKYDCVVSPDFGALEAAKVYQDILNINDLAVISKVRKKINEVDSVQLIGDVNNKNVVIFDDMIDTGNTLIKVSNLLKKKGAKAIDVYATHGIFSNGASKKLMNSNIDNVYVTNTYPFEENLHTDTININNEILDKLVSIFPYNYNILES